ncbi:TauD/TfdA family dioxygenase [Caballeronia sp. LZ003]|uniref:TauD/TfdA family dioxygenase n=1 Tax=unclassified Caballeronia TaxID=2646786 RepID=UPI0038578914
MLVFPDQRLDDDFQQAFIERFGEPVVASRKEICSHHPHFYDIGTVDDHGVPIEAASVKHRYHQANLLWHTDGSFMQPPNPITALHARVCSKR